MPGGTGNLRRAGCALVLGVLLAMAWPATSGAALQLVNLGSIASPMDIESTSSQPTRIYVTSKTGTIRVFNSGRLAKAPLLDLTSRPNPSDDVDSSGEGGLISVAFDPSFASNGHFYVYYTTGTQIRWSRFTATASDVEGSESVLLSFPKPPDNEHYAGRIAIGPDGNLWGVIGDGGPDGIDPDGQDLTTLYGKLLRITTSGGIPSDNPFVRNPNARHEIWAYGLRNPFKFSFDRTTGDLTLADVGWNTEDEIDFQAAPNRGKGANFGWSCYEGDTFVDTGGVNSNCGTATFTAPAMTISHAGLACLSIIGGYVDRDANTPSLTGKYVYGDFCNGDIRSVTLSSSGAAGDAATGLTVPHVDTFGEDPCGRLYAASFDGKIYRIKDGRVHASTACG
jgi:glucose/arabinose dehydrogenase